MITIAICVAIISTIGFLSLWFYIVNKEMNFYKNSLNSAKSCLESHTKRYKQERSTERRHDAYNVLEIGFNIYLQTIENYNRAIKKPQNIIPAFLMGFKRMSTDYIDKNEYLWFGEF